MAPPFLRLLSFVPLLACAAPWEAVDRSTFPKPEGFPDVGAVILLDSKVVDLREDGGEPVAETTVRRKLALLRDPGRDWLVLRAYYDPDFETVLWARARTVAPGGEEKTYDRSDMEDVLAVSGSALYEDDRVVRLDMGSVPLGSHVEFEYRIRQRQPHLFREQMLFGLPVPVQRAHFEIVAPPGWSADHQVRELGAPLDWAPEVERTPEGGTRWRWEKRDIPAFKPEPDGPEYVDMVPRVAVRLAEWTIDGQRHQAPRDAKELSKWLYALHEGTAEVTPEIAAQVREVLRGAPDDPHEKARRLYRWVQAEVRYVAVEIGMGGWKPHPAREVLETRYGDCKDKATLLKAMLHEVGIRSRLASLYAHHGLPRPLEAPVLGTTNHAILVVDLPERRVVADPTSRTVPFGELPVSDQGAELLPVAEGGAEPIVTEWSSPERNTRSVRLDLTITDDGASARGTFAVEAAGAFAASYHWDLLQQLGKNLDHEVADWIGLVRAKVERRGEADTDEDRVRLSGELSVRDVLGLSAPVRVVKLSDLFPSVARQLPVRERKTPVVRRMRERQTLELRLALPEGLRASLPQPSSVESKYGAYSLGWSLEGPTLVARSTWELRQNIVPASEYQALLAFYGDVVAAESAGVVLRSER